MTGYKTCFICNSDMKYIYTMGMFKAKCDGNNCINLSHALTLKDCRKAYNEYVKKTKKTLHKK